MVWCEMRVLLLIYSYVAVCMFCAVRCLIIICLSLLLSNYSTYVFNILLMFVFVFYFVYSVFLYCYVLSLSYFYTRLTTTAISWKHNCSK
jgi:hypothetical protein